MAERASLIEANEGVALTGAGVATGVPAALGVEDDPLAGLAAGAASAGLAGDAAAGVAVLFASCIKCLWPWLLCNSKGVIGLQAEEEPRHSARTKMARWVLILDEVFTGRCRSKTVCCFHCCSGTISCVFYSHCGQYYSFSCRNHPAVHLWHTCHLQPAPAKVTVAPAVCQPQFTSR